jgi:hypothetical protein
LAMLRAYMAILIGCPVFIGPIKPVPMSPTFSIYYSFFVS